MPQVTKDLFILTAPQARPGEHLQMLVRAKSLREARELAADEAVDGQTSVWTDPKRTEYKRLARDVAGRPEVVMAALADHHR